MTYLMAIPGHAMPFSHAMPWTILSRPTMLPFHFRLQYPLTFVTRQNDQLPDGLIAQLVELCTGITEIMGSNPVHVWIFFRLLKLCAHLRLSIMSSYLSLQFKYKIFLISTCKAILFQVMKLNTMSCHVMSCRAIKSCRLMSRHQVMLGYHFMSSHVVP